MYNVAIVGVTGVVGQKMLEVLTTHNFPINELRVFASEKSKGKKINFQNKEYIVETIQEDSFNNTDFVFCSADSSVSKKIGPPVNGRNLVSGTGFPI